MDRSSMWWLSDARPGSRAAQLYEDSIRARAYQRWLEKGQPPLSQLQDWIEAEAELLHEKDFVEAGSVLLQAIVDNTTAAIYVKDLEGRYLLVNRWYEAHFRSDRAEIVGRTDAELFGPAQAAAFRANDAGVLRADGPVEYEEQVAHDDGPHTYLSLKFPIRNRRGQAYAVCGISTDITERQRMTRRLSAEHAVARALAEASTLHDAAPRVLRAIGEAVGWRVAGLWCVDGPSLALRCVDLWHAPAAGCPEFDRLRRRLVFGRGVGLPGRVWATRAPVWIPDLRADPEFLQADVAAREGLGGALALPVQVAGETIGVIEFFDRRLPAPDDDLLEMLQVLCSQVGLFIERKRAEMCLQERTLELRLAQRIQQGFFPSTPPAVPGYAIAAASLPAQETGGDYLDFVPLPDGALGVAVGDVSGHGVGAALLMAVTRAYLRAFARTRAGFDTIVPQLNGALVEDTDPEHFVTLLLARLDPAAGRLSYCSAGHLPGYVLGADGRTRHVLPSTGLPLGLAAGADFPLGAAVELHPGDLLLLMTDGVMEAFGPGDRQYGLERALDFVRARQAEPPTQILQELFKDVRTFCAGLPQHDDRSALIIKVAP